MNAIPELLRRPLTVRRTVRRSRPLWSNPFSTSSATPSVVDDEEFEILETGAIWDELPEDR